MMIRSAAVLFAAAALAAPATSAFAQAEHAQKIAEELALRRAQVRALRKCEMEARPMTPTDPRQAGQRLDQRLPTYPPTGTGGPVRVQKCPPDFFGTD